MHKNLVRLMKDSHTWLNTLWRVKHFGTMPKDHHLGTSCRYNSVIGSLEYMSTPYLHQ